MRGLDGKVAVVTGGATLVGQGVVTAFHEAGTRVVVADIDQEGGKTLVEQLGTGVIYIPTDLTDDASIQACVEQAVATLGRLDFVVNLACSYVDQGLASSRADWLTSFDVNVVGAVMMTKAALPQLKANRGAVVNFGSISSKVAQTGRWLYPVSKAAVVQLTRAMAMDLAADGIRVNSVSPGWTWSKIMRELTGDDRAKTDRVAAPFHLLGRAGDPAEVAAVVLFLCSDDASFVTGADYAVDGGYSAMGPEQAVPAIPLLME